MNKNYSYNIPARKKKLLNVTVFTQIKAKLQIYLDTARRDRAGQGRTGMFAYVVRAAAQLPFPVVVFSTVCSIQH